jgi:thiamine kinase-like enzyme
MTHEEKVKHTKSACELQNLNIDEKTIDQIVMTYEVVLNKGSKFSLKDAFEIEYAIARKYLKRRNKTLIHDFIKNNEMSTRLKNVLRVLNRKGEFSTGRIINFIEDVTIEALELIRNSGKGTVNEFKEIMAKKGLTLK